MRHLLVRAQCACQVCVTLCAGPVGGAAAANERQKQHKFELNQLTRGIVFYKRLGLELESIEPSGMLSASPPCHVLRCAHITLVALRRLAEGEEGRMRMVFTRLHPYDAERMFSFTLGVNEHNEFECECWLPTHGGVRSPRSATDLPLFPLLRCQWWSAFRRWQASRSCVPTCGPHRT